MYYCNDIHGKLSRFCGLWFFCDPTMGNGSPGGHFCFSTVTVSFSQSWKTTQADHTGTCGFYVFIGESKTPRLTGKNMGEFRGPQKMSPNSPCHSVTSTHLPGDFSRRVHPEKTTAKLVISA